MSLCGGDSDTGLCWSPSAIGGGSSALAEMMECEIPYTRLHSIMKTALTYVRA